VLGVAFPAMPRKRNTREGVPVTIRLTQGQVADIDFLIENGERFGSSRPAVIVYFVQRELDRLDERRALNPRKGQDEK